MRFLYHPIYFQLPKDHNPSRQMALAVPSPLERGNYLTVARQRQPLRRVETRLASRVKRDDVLRLHRRGDGGDDGGRPPRLNLIYVPRPRISAPRGTASRSTSQSAGRHFVASGRPSNVLARTRYVTNFNQSDRPSGWTLKQARDSATDRLPSARSVADRFRASTRARTRVSRDR
ncbi:hypothetical protein EAG_15431 [Camponotus floridanus]|uniref:Uncharacterized protein n=1 Tax=Camponotus floridanus TaxID=104421 RepID=E2AXP1_CAMFO|nr:hypothetical protein EAG_15431 [Camponotus floridanus]